VKRLFEDKVALVTGGAMGIGKATAFAFAREGAKVVVADLAEIEGQEVVDTIKKNGSDAIFVKCDVSRAGDVERMIKTAVDTYGHLDCCFNNAGISVFGLTADLKEEEWDRAISVDLKGVWLCMKYEIPQMVKQGHGAIVNCASVAAYIGTPTLCAYTAAKHGVIGLTKTAALEYIKAGVRINAVCPGVTLTTLTEKTPPALLQAMIEQHPIGRLGRADEIAEAVLWLCSDLASFSTGIAMPVDGGLLA
jgi:NAD(P)-dependent dehydrogenase (short-subunit alcohol dehydrogenase family)